MPKCAEAGVVHHRRQRVHDRDCRRRRRRRCPGVRSRKRNSFSSRAAPTPGRGRRCRRRRSSGCRSGWRARATPRPHRPWQSARVPDRRRRLRPAGQRHEPQRVGQRVRLDGELGDFGAGRLRASHRSARGRRASAEQVRGDDHAAAAARGRSAPAANAACASTSTNSAPPRAPARESAAAPPPTRGRCPPLPGGAAGDDHRTAAALERARRRPAGRPCRGASRPGRRRWRRRGCCRMSFIVRPVTATHTS